MAARSRQKAGQAARCFTSVCPWPAHRTHDFSVSATIHIVDDDASFRTLTGRLFARLWLCSRDLCVGRGATERLPDDGEPGCVLLDINMPGVSGPDLQAGLNGAASSLPIVFLTGHYTADPRERLEEDWPEPSGRRERLIVFRARRSKVPGTPIWPWTEPLPLTSRAEAQAQRVSLCTRVLSPRDFSFSAWRSRLERLRCELRGDSAPTPLPPKTTVRIDTVKGGAAHAPLLSL
jgi:CheY-like chemotaxis protein